MSILRCLLVDKMQKSQKWKLTYSHGPLKFARRVVDLTGSGVILQKIPARKSEVPYVTNLNEFNGDFTYTPSERADELNRKEIHNQDSFHCIKMCFILEG